MNDTLFSLLGCNRYNQFTTHCESTILCMRRSRVAEIAQGIIIDEGKGPETGMPVGRALVLKFSTIFVK